MFTKAWFFDIVERVVATFAAAFLGSLLLAGANVLHLSSWHTAALAGVAAALSFLKGLVASFVGNRGTPSLATEAGQSPGPVLKPSTRIHSSPAPKRAPRKPRAPAGGHR
jgi:hypothetical protein